MEEVAAAQRSTLPHEKSQNSPKVEVPIGTKKLDSVAKEHEADSKSHQSQRKEVSSTTVAEDVVRESQDEEKKIKEQMQMSSNEEIGGDLRAHLSDGAKK